LNPTVYNLDSLDLLNPTVYNLDSLDLLEVTVKKSSKYHYLKKLGMKPSDLLNKQTEAAFGYTFSDPMERFKLFQQLIELRMFLAKSGIKSKKDLELLLAEKGL